MSGERETFIKVSDHMPDHPKVVGLSDKAFRAMVTLWCYCSRYRTDGVVVPAVWKKEAPGKVGRELIAAGLAAERPDAGAEMHNYLVRQRSREQIEALSEKRAAAGKRGGRPPTKKQPPKQNALDLPSNTASKRNPDDRGSTTYFPDRENPSGSPDRGSAPPERREPAASRPAMDPATTTPNQRANALASAYYDAVNGFCTHQQIAKIARKAVDSGRYGDKQIEEALLRLADRGQSVTADALRTELDGPPQRASASLNAATQAASLRRPINGGQQPHPQQITLPEAGGF